MADNKPMNTLLQLKAAVDAARARTGDQHIGTQVGKGGIDVVRAVPPASGRGKYDVTVLRAGLTLDQALDFLKAM